MTCFWLFSQLIVCISQQGHDDEARTHLLWAMNLDPHGSSKVFKDAIERNRLLDDNGLEDSIHEEAEDEEEEEGEEDEADQTFQG